jgi:hypothetical protein
MNRNRYNTAERPNRQEIAAHRRDQRLRGELRTAGHDEIAASRARRIVRHQELLADMCPTLPTDELRDVLRETVDRNIAEIRAAGPVGCTCTHPLCIESRPVL